MVLVVVVRGRCMYASGGGDGGGGGRLVGDYGVSRVGSGGSGGEGDT